jgi:hypothetical protein
VAAQLIAGCWLAAYAVVRMCSEHHEQTLGDAEDVRRAARLSLGARGVRVQCVRVREADGGWTDPWSWEIGVADPAARSIRLQHFIARDSPSSKLVDAAVRRWPWLGEGPRSESDPERGGESIEIGPNHYFGGPGGWIDFNWNDQPVYGPAHALWPLEAILGTTTATGAGTIDLRGERCTRYLCEVQPAQAADRTDVQLVDDPKPDDDWRRLTAEVCIDATGRVRRIAWSPVLGRRRRPGLLQRLAAALERGPTSDETTGSHGRLWNLIEFWDYGCPAEIAAPSAFIDRTGASCFDIARDLWRMRREYKQRHPRSATRPKLR